MQAFTSTAAAGRRDKIDANRKARMEAAAKMRTAGVKEKETKMEKRETEKAFPSVVVSSSASVPTSTREGG